MLWLTLVGSGCIWSPAVEPVPEEQLHPPTIVMESLSPPEAGMTNLTEQCQGITFEVGFVRDRNANDTIYVRWFLDWDGNRDAEPDKARTIKDTQIDRFGPALRFYVDSQGMTKGEAHTVKVFVADRALKQIGLDFPDTPEGRQGQTDTWQWTFRRIEEGTYCDE